jgi:hypothetical protein
MRDVLVSNAPRGLCLALALLAGCSCEGPDPRGRDAGRRDAAGLDAPGLDTNEPSLDDGGIAPADIVVIVPGTPADAASRFDDPDDTGADTAPDILYPLDHVLFPRNVWSPDVQWGDPGVAGDLYRVRFSAPPVTVTAYLVHTGDGFRWDHELTYGQWRLLTNAAAGGAMTLAVDRWIAASHTVAHGADRKSVV